MEQLKYLPGGAEGMGLVQSFTRAMRHMPDTEKTWEEILRVMISVTRGENCSLMLKSHEDRVLLIRMAKGKRDSAIDMVQKPFRKLFSLNGGVAEWVLSTGRGVHLSDAEEDARFVEIEESPLKIGSLMCFPVRDGDQTVGLVNLSHRDKAVFGDLEEKAIKIASNQLAIVLANAQFADKGAYPAGSIDTVQASEPLQVSNSQRTKRTQVVIPWSNGNGNGENIHFLYQSEKMVRIMEMIDQIADTDVTVLIHGESGVGKEPVARALHYRSSRRKKPFIKVNCAALPDELLESELFGYEKGAFTGAYNRKPGKFELANGGTILLDEIAEISPALQAKLLQVLQDGEFARLGGKEDIHVNVRVLVATNKNLEEYVMNGRFREDLYYRLNVLNIHVPPLRERRDEIAILAQYFLDKYSRKYGKSVQPLSREVIDSLLLCDWPGNVRELENMMKRLVVLGDEQAIKRELHHRSSIDPQPEVRSQAVDRPRSVSLKEISRKAALEAEREVIQKTLEQTHWNRKMASRLLAISYKALLYKIKECGLDVQPSVSPDL